MSRVTDAVLEEVREWQNRRLDPVYPVVFFDALRGQDPRRGPGTEQGGLTSPWRSSLKATRRCWGCGSSRLRGPILAQGDERTQGPRPARHPHRGGGRAQGLSLRRRHGVPAHGGPEYTLTPPPSCPTSQDHLTYTPSTSMADLGSPSRMSLRNSLASLDGHNE